MLLVLEALKNEISLLVFEFLNTVVGPHIIELSNFITLNKLFSTVIQIMLNLVGIFACSVWMEHVGTEVQDCSLVDISILVIQLL